MIIEQAIAKFDLKRSRLYATRLAYLVDRVTAMVNCIPELAVEEEGSILLVLPAEKLVKREVGAKLTEFTFQPRPSGTFCPLASTAKTSKF